MFTPRLAFAAAILTTTVGIADATAEAGPGACACGPATDAPPPAVGRVLPRWGVGLQLTSLSLDATDMTEASHLAGAGLQLRYRIAPRWVVELSAAHVQDDGRGDARDAVALVAQFHPRPAARWDLYLVAGFGATSAAAPELTDEERAASRVGNAQLGGGVERRLGRIGVAAELRLLSGEAPTSAASARMTPTTASAATRGGAAAVSATYYF